MHELIIDEIVSIEETSEEETFSLEMADPCHNYRLENSLVTRNSHSLAYSMITYQTAWLKANYRVEYMAALLSSVMDDHERVSLYSDNCREQGIHVRCPDINYSGENFAVHGNEIRIGLTVVKGVGLPVVRKIVDARSRVGQFRDLNHFFEEIGPALCNSKVMDSLIRAGCFDSLGIHRAALLAQYPVIVETYKKALKKGKKQIPGQTMLFEISEKFVADPVPVPEVAKLTRLEELAFEKELIGVYVSGHPLDSYKGGLNYLNNLIIPREGEDTEDEVATEDGEPAAFAGVFNITKVTQTKKGLPMLLGELQGIRDTIKVVVWPSAYEPNKALLKSGAFISVVGKYQNDGKPTILVEQVAPLESARALVVTVPPTIEMAALNSLKSMLKGRDDRPQGTSPVVFEVQGSSQHAVAGPTFWCNPTSELIAKLERACRDASIEVRPLI